MLSGEMRYKIRSITDSFNLASAPPLARCHPINVSVNRGAGGGELVAGKRWSYRRYRHSSIIATGSLFPTNSLTTHCEFVERVTNNKYQQTPPSFQPLTPVLYLINTLAFNANKIPSLFYVCGMFNYKL
jgi:hypothetical protein